MPNETSQWHPFNKVNVSYNKVLDNRNKEIACECGMLIHSVINNDIKYRQLSEKEKGLAQFLSELEYINISVEDDTISILMSQD